MQPNQIKSAIVQLEHERKVIEELWTDVERYVCPYRGKFYEPQRTEGEFRWFRPHRLDDTAVRAHNRLSETLNSKFTPSAIKWFAYKFADTKLNDSKPMATWMESCTDRVNRELANSLFGESMGEFYSDFTSFHSAYIGRELESYREWEGMDFKCLPLKECFAERDHRGRIVRFYRKQNLNVLQMAEKFGLENMPKMYRDRFEAEVGDKTLKYPVIFACYKRNIGKPERTNRAVSPQARPYGYRYIDYSTLEPFGEEGGYYTMPVYYVRFRKAVGSEYGYGPATECMSDIKTLNRLVYLDLKQLEIQVNPPTMTTEDNLITDLDLSEGGLTVVEDIEGTRPYLSGGRLDIAEARIQRIQSAIEKAFHIDQLYLKTSPAMTATEVAALTRQQHETIGSPLSNLKSQGLKPMLEDIFFDMLRFDRFDDPPAGLDIENLELDIEYFGALALAQKADTAAAIERTVGNVSGMAEVFPEIVDVFNPDEIAKEMGNLTGAPAKIYRSDGEIQEIREQRAAVMEEQRRAEQAKTEAEAANSLAGAVNQMVPGQGAGLAEVLAR